MVKAYEVRLGNLIIHNKSGCKEVCGFQANWIALKDDIPIFVEETECRGIEVNGELLEKCRFHKVPRTKNLWWIHLLPKGSMTIKKKEDGFEVFFVSDLPIVDNIKYLHQLQNLYFVLTNTELDISALQ